MSELTLEAAHYAALAEPKCVFDDGNTKLYAPGDPPELIALIKRQVDRAKVNPAAWAIALEDFAANQACRALDGKLTHSCFDAAVAHDTAQFGEQLAKHLRLRIAETAEDKAREEYEDAHAWERTA